MCSTDKLNSKVNTFAILILIQSTTDCIPEWFDMIVFQLNTWLIFIDISHYLINVIPIPISITVATVTFTATSTASWRYSSLPYWWRWWGWRLTCTWALPCCIDIFLFYHSNFKLQLKSYKREESGAKSASSISRDQRLAIFMTKIEVHCRSVGAC